MLPVLSPANAIVLPHIISADADANDFIATVFFLNSAFLVVVYYFQTTFVPYVCTIAIITNIK